MTIRDERLVELYVGTGGSEGGTWYVEDVYVDYSLSDEEAGQAAINKFYEKYANTDLDGAVAFVGVYSIWSDDEMESFWTDYDDMEEDEDDYDCDCLTNRVYQQIDAMSDTEHGPSGNNGDDL